MFCPQFLKGTTLTFLRRIVRAVYCSPFGKVWLSSVWLVSFCEACRLWIRMQHLRRVGKNNGPILSRLWTKVHVVSKRCRRSLLVAKHFPDCLYHVSFWRYRSFNLPLNCDVVEKGGFWAPVCNGRDTPHFGRAFLNRSYFWPCPVLVDFRSASSEGSGRKIDRIAVKRKSADKTRQSTVSSYSSHQN